MYKCIDCDYIFDTPETQSEDYGYYTELGYRSAKQEFSVCPNCGSDCFREAYECEGCGDWFLKDEMIDDYCCDCYAEREEEDYED
jgi:hypothetical protein